jgi:hypothetical protein
MKKWTCIIICVSGLTSLTYAQHQDTNHLGKDIKQAADTVAQRTKEAAAKGTAKLIDKTYADKVGPGGQTIYIDKHAKYYYVSKSGEKVYVKKAQLKDKPKE